MSVTLALTETPVVASRGEWETPMVQRKRRPRCTAGFRRRGPSILLRAPAGVDPLTGRTREATRTVKIPDGLGTSRKTLPPQS